MVGFVSADPRRLVLLHVAGSLQEVKDRGELVEAVLGKRLGSGDTDRCVYVSLGGASGVGRGNEDASSVVRVGDPVRESGALKSVDDRGCGGWAEFQGMAEFASRQATLAGQEQVQRPQVRPVEFERGGGGLVESIEALLQQPEFGGHQTDQITFRHSKTPAIVMFDPRIVL